MLNADQVACWVQRLGLTIGLGIEKGLKQVGRWKQDDLSDLSLFVGQSAGGYRRSPILVSSLQFKPILRLETDS